MKKIKLFTFLILMFCGLFYLLNLYSNPVTLSIYFDDVIINDALRSKLNFSFTLGMENGSKNTWHVKNGELRIGKMDKEIIKTTSKPYFPYSTLAYPFSYEFSDFIVSESLDVDYSVEFEPTDNGKFAYPQQVNFNLFDELETDLTMPIKNNEIVCMENNQEYDCQGGDYELWLKDKLKLANIVYAESEDFIYWSLSNTDDLIGKNHLYKCEKGRFDQSSAISSWENQEKTVLAIAHEEDRIVLICADRIDEYDKDGKLLTSIAFTPLDGLTITRLQQHELMLIYYDAKDAPSYYNHSSSYEVQAVQSIDLDTHWIYDYNLTPLRDINDKTEVRFEKGLVYLLINEGNKIRVEVYEDYEKVYEGFIHHDERAVFKGMPYTNVEWR